MALAEQTMSQKETGSISKWRALFLMTISPGAVLKSHFMKVSPLWAFFISGSAFAIFFLQTGLDLARNGKSYSVVFALTAIGALYGTVFLTFLAVVAWVLSQPFGGAKPVGWTIRAFALGYSPALIYSLIGLSANIFLGWNTAVTFGVTGFLWTLGPMIAAIREMVEQRIAVSVIIATFCGGLLLFGWSLISLKMS